MTKILLSLLPFLALATVSGYRWKRVRSLGQTCFPRDSCYEGSTIVSLYRNCQCDDYCSYYGDCCWDAGRQFSARPPDESTIKCQGTSFFEGYYVTSSCQKSRNDRYMERKCREGADITNPLSKTPVTSVDTNITYGNYYCAICNGDSANLIFWLTFAECPTLVSGGEERKYLVSYVRQNFTYNPYCREWGVWLRGEFHKCKMNLKPPRDYEEKTFRPCFPGVTSRCSSTWRNERIRRKCESYTAITFSPNNRQSFRNIYCAICNYVDVRLLRCTPPHGRVYLRSSSSFRVLLDVKKRNCEGEQFYDPFFKKCTNFVCGFANRKLVNGKCVRVN